MSPTTTISPTPKWERVWILKGRGYDVVTVCRQFDTKRLSRLEPRAGQIPPQTRNNGENA